MGLLRRREPQARLDPVRRHRPGRATLVRAATVALLVAMAGVLVWSGPAPCGAAPPAGAPPAADMGGAPSRAHPRVPAETPGTERRAVPAGRVGVPLRLTEPAALTIIEPGSRVDVLHVDDSGRSARMAEAALVLGVTDADDPVTAGLLVALTPAEAERVVAHTGRGFAVLLRPAPAR